MSFDRALATRICDAIAFISSSVSHLFCENKLMLMIGIPSKLQKNRREVTRPFSLTASFIAFLAIFEHVVGCGWRSPLEPL